MGERTTQPAFKMSTVLASGFASVLAALITSRFGVGGTVFGAALTAMVITGGSAIFGFYMDSAAERARNIPLKPPGQVAGYHRRSTYRTFGSASRWEALAGPYKHYPARRATRFATPLIALVLSLIVGQAGIAGLEFASGKSLSCRLWDRCPDVVVGGSLAPTTHTRPSILSGPARTDGHAPQLRYADDLQAPEPSTTPLEQRVVPRVPATSPRNTAQVPEATTPLPTNMTERAPVENGVLAGSPREKTLMDGRGGEQPAVER